MMPRVAAINALSNRRCKSLPTVSLRAKTDEFRQKIKERLSHLTPLCRAGDPDADSETPDRQKQIEKEQYDALQEVLDEILVEAFAVVREAGRRVLNMRHFDVQLVGGMVQHKGMISEMKDRRRQNAGRHSARLSQRPQWTRRARGYGQRLLGQKRDSEWMGKLYRFLGLTIEA